MQYFGYNVKSSNSVEKIIGGYVLRKPNLRQKMRILKQSHSAEIVKGTILNRRCSNQLKFQKTVTKVNSGCIFATLRCIPTDKPLGFLSIQFVAKYQNEGDPLH